MKYFINYDVNRGISIDTSRNAYGYFNFDVGGLVDDIINGYSSCCDLDGALDMLESDVWSGSIATIELLDYLHALIVEFEKTLSEFKSQLEGFGMPILAASIMPD